MSDAEPPPMEEIAADTGRARQGGLHIYLGAAPGVGKTYAMLREGRRLRDEGHDVVVGFVETHGRADTEDQLGDLEIVPRLTVRHRTLQMEEMDVDAIVQRRPEIVLVDELAHTNAPGSPRTKRYQDVDVLRDHGLDVITTLNIQHVSELQDVVAGITGIEVRETIPDKVLDDATEVQLVDLPVEVLLRRLEQGKIYRTDQANKALVNFFREGNLTALRELALRRTAEDVDDQLSDLMLSTVGVTSATERVLVVVDGHDRWGDVLRSAWRLASALHGDLLALTMAPGGQAQGQRGSDPEATARHQELAEDLGARVLVLSGDTEGEADPIDALLRVIGEERITVLVLGVRHRARRSWLGGPKLEGMDTAVQVITRLDGLDVHLVKMAERDTS